MTAPMLHTLSAMTAKAAEQLSGGSTQQSVDSGGKKGDFQALLTQKQQVTQDTSGTGSNQGQATDEPLSDTGTGLPTQQQELAAALVAQNVVILSNDVLVQPQSAATQAELGVVGTASRLAQETAGQEMPLQTAVPDDASVTPDQAGSAAATVQTVRSEELLPEADPQPEPLPQPVQTQSDAPIQKTAEYQKGSYAGTQEETNEYNPVQTAETHLFRDVKATPIQVGQPEQLDTQSADFEQQFAARLTGTLDQGVSRLEITLTPDSLGTVVVEMTQDANGALQVVLSAAEQKTQTMLQQHAAGLQGLLAGSTQSTVEVVVPRQQENQAAQDHSYDQQGHGGQQSQQDSQQDSRRQRQENDEFIQQLRLGLAAIGSEGSAV